MRIAYFTDTFLPQVNGVATSVANTAKELGKMGHKIIIFSPKLGNIKRAKFKADNVEVVYLPSLPAKIYPEFRLSLFGLPKVLKHIGSFKPDIIHFHTPITVGFDALLASKILRKPLVGTMHAYLATPDWVGWIRNKYALEFVSEFSKKYCKFFYDYCDLQLCPSKKLIKELYKAGFKKPIRHLLNSVYLPDVGRFLDGDKERIRKKFKLEKKAVLHFGRLSHEKRVDQVIRAFAIIARNKSNVSLFIIGDGPAKPDLEQLAKDLMIDKRVVFTGFIANKELLSSGMLSVGDVFATASPMENQPMAVLEAMSYGLPIVGVREAGMLEIVSKNGFLVPAGDVDEFAGKIEYIINNVSAAQRMGEISRKLAEGYSVEKISARLVKLYQGTIEAHRKKHKNKKPLHGKIKEVLLELEKELKESLK